MVTASPPERRKLSWSVIAAARRGAGSEGRGFADSGGGWTTKTEDVGRRTATVRVQSIIVSSVLGQQGGHGDPIGPEVLLIEDDQVEPFQAERSRPQVQHHTPRGRRGRRYFRRPESEPRPRRGPAPR